MIYIYIEIGNMIISLVSFFFLQSVLAGLDSKDWVSVCDALNNVRRLSIFHKEAMLHIL